jgi:hypothetical protein
MDEWAHGLAGMTGEQIRRGLDSWQEPWPPSLPEFKRACIGADNPHNTAAYKRFPKALPKPKASAQVVAECMAMMREALK